MVGRVVDVRPVDQRRDAGVEALQRPGVVGGVHVLGAVQGREGVQDLDEVVVQGGIGCRATDRGLPGVPVRVDEAGDDDEPFGVDDLGVGLDVGLYGGDRVAFDEHVAFR